MRLSCFSRNILFFILLILTSPQTKLIKSIFSTKFSGFGSILNSNVVDVGCGSSFISLFKWKSSGTYVELELQCENDNAIDPRIIKGEITQQLTTFYTPFSIIGSDPTKSAQYFDKHTLVCQNPNEVLNSIKIITSSLNSTISFAYNCISADIFTCNATSTSEVNSGDNSLIYLTDINFSGKSGTALRSVQLKSNGNNYWMDYTYCTLCHYACDECNSAAPKMDCVACKQGYFSLSDNPSQCYSTCPEGYFLFYDAISNMSICQRCDETCSTCSSISKCDSCNLAGAFYPLFNITNESQILPGVCYSICPNNYWKDFNTQSCQPCHPSCNGCLDGTDNCNECNSQENYISIENTEKCVLECDASRGYFYDSKKNMCAESCSKGYYAFTSSSDSASSCLPCDDTCQTCSGSSNHCLGCKNGEFYIPSLYTCVSDCKTINGFYNNLSTNTCLPCSYECLNCEGSPDHCTACNPGHNLKLYFYEKENSCNSKCPDGYYADITSMLCKSGENLINPSTLDVMSNMSTTLSIEIIKGLSSMIRSDTFYTKDDINKIYSITQNQLSLMIAGFIPADPHIVILADACLSLQVGLLNISMSMAEKFQFQNRINEIKKLVSLIMDLVMGNYANKNTVSIGGSMLNLQFGSLLEKDKIIQLSREKNLSIVDFNNCENVLKEKYSIPSNYSLNMIKFDYGSELNLDNLGDSMVSSSVAFDLYDPITKNKLNLSFCANTTIPINIPLKAPDSLKLNLYKRLNSSGIDIFNPDDPSFTSRCKPVIKNSTDADTTVNYRRKHYYNGTAICSGNCTYSGLDEYFFMKCICTDVTEGQEIFNNIENKPLSSLSSINLDIVLCAAQIKDSKLHKNPAIYICALSIGFAIFGSLMAWNVNINLIYNPASLNKMLYNDAWGFDKINMKIEEYFIEKANQGSVNIKEVEIAVTNENILYPKPKAVGNVQSKVIELKNIINDEDLNVKSFKSAPVEVNIDIIDEKEITKKIILNNPLLTHLDFNELTPLQALEFDKRGFWVLFWTYFVNQNYIFWLIFKTSLFSPFWIRNIFVIFKLSMIFAANAIFFSDVYINERAKISKHERVKLLIFNILKLEFVQLYCPK